MVETFCGGTIIERPESLKYKLKYGIVPEDDQIRSALEILIDGDFNVSEYGGKERKYKGMTRIEVWNESIKYTTFREAKDEDLSLLLARTTRYQKSSATAYISSLQAKSSGTRRKMRGSTKAKRCMCAMILQNIRRCVSTTKQQTHIASHGLCKLI